MYQKYLVTGALQPVGHLVVKMLAEAGNAVRVLVPPESDTSSLRGLDIEISEGDITDKESMKDFFKIDDPRHSALIHTEELVSMSDKTNISMRRINVTGSNNIVDQCLKNKMGRLVCLGSAYSINPKASLENCVLSFDRTKVEGDYAKSKAEAAAYVMEKVSLNKLNAVMLLPTFIIGPGFGEDYDMNKILKSYIEKGVSPVKGGHAFVDVRDVALALVSLTEEGQTGGSYVLNGEHKKTEDFFADVSKANGNNAPVKTMPKWMMGKTLGKFVDTYYRISKKDNPKEVYALFMNAPDQNFDSTLPSGNARSIFDSINDAIHNVQVDVTELVAQSDVLETSDVEEVAEAEAVEEAAEETPVEEEKPTSVLKLNIPSVLGSMSILSERKAVEESAAEQTAVEETEEVAETEAEAEEATEVTEVADEEAAEPEVEEVAEEEPVVEEAEDEAVVEEATEDVEVTEESEVEAVVEDEVEAEENPEVEEAEADTEESAEEEVEAEPEVAAEEVAEEAAEEDVPEEPVAEEIAAEEPAPEEPAADEPMVPIWNRPGAFANIDSLDDLDDLDNLGI